MSEDDEQEATGHEEAGEWSLGPARPRPSGAEGVRIAGVEAGVAAGLVPPVEPTATIPTVQAAPEAPRAEQEVLLPWSEPPTGQVPRVLRGSDAGEEDEALRTVRGPSWRDAEEDWGEADFDLSHLAGEAPIASGGGTVDDVDPFSFSFLGEDSDSGHAVVDGVAGAGPEEEDLWVRGGSGRRRSGRSRIHPPVPTAVEQADAPPRSASVATATGIVVGAVAILCLAAGAVSSLCLVAVAVSLAAAEVFSALRAGGYRPATLIGLLAVPAVVTASYFAGTAALPAVLALVVILSSFWYLVAAGRVTPLPNLAATVLAFSWLGGLGAFAGLLLSPAAFPHRHGVAFLIGAVAAAVGHDVFGFAIGRTFGRHPLAPEVSPAKTWEGLIGGMVGAFLIAILVVAHIHPWTFGSAALLGLLVAIVAPLGDLTESLVKRGLGVKDMGSLLPADGGVLDRVDSILFALPVTYYIVHLMHPL